jgi:hypothetical protein
VVSVFDLKLERAWQQIEVLEGDFKTFFTAKPFTVSNATDPKTGEWVSTIQKAAQIPPILGLKTGEVVQTLRTALDYLAYDLTVKHTGSQYCDRSGFPFFKSAGDFSSSKNQAVKGMSPEVIQLLEKYQPYHRDEGNRLLGELHNLSNTDKHRTLLLMGTCNSSFTMHTDSALRMMKSTEPNPFPRFKSPPLEEGDELLRLPGYVRPPLTFTFDAVFGEPGAVEGKYVVGGLHYFARVVSFVIAQFKPWIY